MMSNKKFPEPPPEPPPDEPPFDPPKPKLKNLQIKLFINKKKLCTNVFNGLK